MLKNKETRTVDVQHKLEGVGVKRKHGIWKQWNIGHTLAMVMEVDDMDVAKHATLPWLCTPLMVFEKETIGLTHRAELKAAGK